MGSYDRYMLKLNEKNIAPLIKEWVDLLLFVNYRTDIVTDQDGKTKKGRGGQKRVMYANHSACWDAKNRFGLPDEMPFDYAQVAHLFGEAPPVDATEIPEEKPEPMKTTKPNATVTTCEKVPEVKTKNAAQEPAGRPEDMKSDNPEKDKLLETLWEKMKKDGVLDSTILRAVVAEKDYYDLAVPICDYDTDFIEGCLIGAWDQVNQLAQTKIHDLPF
jgi:hypothetical protein